MGGANEGDEGAGAPGSIGEFAGGVAGSASLLAVPTGAEVDGVLAGTPMIGPEEDELVPEEPEPLLKGAYPQALQVQPVESFTISPCLHLGQVTVIPDAPDTTGAVPWSPVKACPTLHPHGEARSHASVIFPGGVGHRRWRT